MAASTEKNDTPREVPDNEHGDPAERRRRARWLVIACVIVIAVTAALIAAELLR